MKGLRLCKLNYQLSTNCCHYFQFNPIKAGIFEGSFSEGNQLDSHSHILRKANLLLVKLYTIVKQPIESSSKLKKLIK